MTLDALRRFAAVIVIIAVAQLLAEPLMADPPGGEESTSVSTMLRVQQGLREGRRQIAKGEFASAIETLETHLAWIDGNHEYLSTLREAYHAQILKLIATKDYLETRRHLRRLEILEPGATFRICSLLPKSVAETLKQPPTASKPRVKIRAKGEDPADLHPLIPPKLSMPPPAQTKSPEPFQLTNHKRYPEAKAFLDQAEQLFLEQKYDQAGELYAKASDTVAEVVEPARERWAYCILAGVIRELNSKERSASYDKLEQQARSALKMTPPSSKLTNYGNSLLQLITSRRGTPSGGVSGAEASEPPSKVEHSQPSGSAWKIAESANFRIFHNQSRDFAKRVAETAEKTRTEAQQRWFGKVDARWSKPCEIYLHATAEDYSQSTNVSPRSQGHATTERKGSQVLARRIDLHVDVKETLDAILPHETTHVCLTGKFGPFDVPRWADEGMAIMGEPSNRREQYSKLLPQYRRQGRLFRIRTIMQMRDWPKEQQDVTMFHAQSVSLVQYLCRLKGHRTFARFLDTSLSGDFESSLRRYYGLRGFDELESRWLAEAVDARR